MKTLYKTLKNIGAIILGVFMCSMTFAQKNGNIEDLAYADENLKQNLSGMPFSVEKLDKERFVIFPKKVTNDFIVEFETEDQKVKYTIYDKFGKAVFKEKQELFSAIISVDISQLKAGTYYIELKSENKTDVQRIVKK